jgi:YbbR domain-containing protein
VILAPSVEVAVAPVKRSSVNVAVALLSGVISVPAAEVASGVPAVRAAAVSAKAVPVESSSTIAIGLSEVGKGETNRLVTSASGVVSKGTLEKDLSQAEIKIAVNASKLNRIVLFLRLAMALLLDLLTAQV